MIPNAHIKGVNGKEYHISELRAQGGLKRDIIELVLNLAAPDDDCMLSDFLHALQYVLDKHAAEPNPFLKGIPIAGYPNSKPLTSEMMDRFIKRNRELMDLDKYNQWPPQNEPIIITGSIQGFDKHTNGSPVVIDGRDLKSIEFVRWDNKNNEPVDYTRTQKGVCGGEIPGYYLDEAKYMKTNEELNSETEQVRKQRDYERHDRELSGRKKTRRPAHGTNITLPKKKRKK